MGRISYETFDPEDLELPNDTDFDYEGIDEAYGSYQEYEAYLPDRVTELRPVDERALDACASAAAAVAEAKDALAASDVADAIARLLLCDEAVSTAQAEKYEVSCQSMLEYRAARVSGGLLSWREAEEVALDAVDALRSFVPAKPKAVTFDEICAANATFARSNRRSEYCGELRERPVFIGKSLFDADYVAPPADTLDEYMDDLVRFLNGVPGSFDPIAKAAIAHAQFITVHPFEDGNGRTGRALAQRVLRNEGVTDGMLLPITAAMVTDLTDYVDVMESMRTYRGPANPNVAVKHYAGCCVGAARQAMALMRHVEDALDSWSLRVSAADGATKRAMRLFAATPAMTQAMLSASLSEDACQVLDALHAAGILQKRRPVFSGVDIYVATDVMRALNDAQGMKA